MIYHSGDEGQSFHIHYYFCGRQILRLHDSQELSHVIHWNWPDCRQSHAFSKGQEILQALMVDLP